MRRTLLAALLVMQIAGPATARELSYYNVGQPRNCQSNGGMSAGQYVAVSGALVAVAVWFWQIHRRNHRVRAARSEWEGMV